MAVCQVCTKQKQYGHNVSHSKRRTKRVFKPNILRKRMRVLSGRNGGDGVRRIKICGKCLKRVKKFGKVKAADGALLSGSVVLAVDWAEKSKIKAEKAKIKDREFDKKDKKGQEKKQEVSIEELVGRKENPNAGTN